MGHKSNRKLAKRIAALPVPAERWPRWVVSGGGPGFLRPAPGSWGTIPPAVLYFLLVLLSVGEPLRSVALLGVALVSGTLLVIFGKWAAAYYRQPDPGTVILDEYAGFAITAIFIPVPEWCSSWPHLALFVFGLYVLFRATDTLKLPPANWLEKLPWGWGILMDDVASGVQANVLAQIVIRLWLMH